MATETLTRRTQVFVTLKRRTSPAKRAKALSTIEEIYEYCTETPEERVNRAESRFEWIERNPSRVPYLDAEFCRVCCRDLSLTEKTYRLKGTPALVICAKCYGYSVINTRLFDEPIQDSFEMTRALGPQINAMARSKRKAGSSFSSLE